VALCIRHRKLFREAVVRQTRGHRFDFYSSPPPPGFVAAESCCRGGSAFGGCGAGGWFPAFTPPLGDGGGPPASGVELICVLRVSGMTADRIA
jgi:hypothetical protein